MKFLVDTNLLVLLIVGSLRPDLIGRTEGLKEYHRSDYQALQSFLGGDGALRLSGFILAELSNIAVRGFREPLTSEVRVAIRALIDRNEETMLPSSVAAARDEYIWLGLTDAAIIELAANDTIIVTADGPLALAAAKADKLVVHFDELRPVA